MSAAAWFRDAAGGGWWRYSGLAAVIEARSLAEVLPALAEVEARVEREGLHAAGCVAYEAAPAFDPALTARPPGAFPLAWFGLYRERALAALPEAAPPAGPLVTGLEPELGAADYCSAVERIRALIEAGDTYQVNLTFRLRGKLACEPWALFCALAAANLPGHAAYLDTGEHIVCSASPELFFRLEGGRIASRPMKGTAPRGRWPEEDAECAARLRASEKDRAENLMIADMVRNDLGRIARPGSVRAPRLFELERYPTLWQMTSTVEAETAAGFAGVLRALFPPASVTGAPKARTCAIIAEIERSPRNLYTGALACLSPGPRALASVAIRTAVIERASGAVEYGVGSGIVWDSRAEAEYAECLLKARILTEPRAEFALLETLLWEPGGGYFLLGRHLRRLAASAAQLDFALDTGTVEARLTEAARGFSAPQRLRLLLARDGGVTIEAAPLAPEPDRPLRLGLAAAPVDPADPLLYHKTSLRRRYDEARAARPGCDDVVLWNGRGEVTETTTANLVAEVGGELVTPPLASGLLPGCYRAELLERGEVRERTISLDELRRSPRLYVVNAVRRMRPAVLVD